MTQDRSLPLCLFKCVCATVFSSVRFFHLTGMFMHKCFVSLHRLPQCPERQPSVRVQQRQLQNQQHSKEPPGLFGSKGFITCGI